MSPARVTDHQGGVICAQANYAVFRTRPGGISEVYNVGRYLDELVRVDGNLKLQARRCVYDSEMVLNSLIYPV
ncbi:aromatic-ring-hydroxylating dioxygenase [Polaromonas sp. P1(28)-13]|nr:aromatic-ring-hydroxylating dioxygenase [Polaromonas sp. P1(28)-13]